MQNPQYLTVKALTKYIKRKFDSDPHLEQVYVKGEISNFKKHSSGHMYFTLKDEDTRIMAVMFARYSSGMKFAPENGMHVLLRGSVSVYEMSGQYQIYVNEMLPDGIGELFLAFEQLKEKLGKEGLFAQEAKKPIPAFPKVIGIVTSPTGAAIRDIIITIKRRYPLGKILVIPALVQGKNAAKTIADAIQKANAGNIADVLIVGRGGGSMEELWAFNEEVVARAIYQSNIPVISAVGHETDVTIADFVADLRAATPTAAAELAVPHIEDLMDQLLQRKTRLYQAMGAIIKTRRNQLSYMEQSYILRNPHKLYEQKWQLLDRMKETLNANQNHIIFQKNNRFEELRNRLARSHPSSLLEVNSERAARAEKRLQQEIRSVLKTKITEFIGKTATLDALNPLSILRRGFNVAHTEDGKLVKSVRQGEIGDTLTLTLVDGKLSCIIENKEEGAENERETDF
ncbi:MAG TPA: exodeoxyribonuclease VII large subunit [Bacillus bacterium]|uniref:Exodeoxyribonuclease 7 large subunit n=1 Tax=Siminovitchia fordii TaxID=254759 RepID=A0ABQ4K2G2_9BACI|nr:exodeoxyribonuclease VII large subunit [Siminovitchia fordii]GIN19951.1 exodeoxyribonuclease 7 large subunit [Siminovitchia fordii]HBZ08565.1 exodeoxyribonuclease VII large subunit [Bacillus sp. (in: firmicutes)]